jgi:hypothetical protein
MTDEKRSRPTTRGAGSRYPDDEAHWITRPADLICCAVALSDPAFAELTTHHHAHQGQNPPRSTKK